MADYIVDAKNKTLGRLATEIAHVLQEKNSPHYNPRLEGSLRVIVKNVKEVRVSGKKAEKKVYYRHTGYMGHLREIPFRHAAEKDMGKVLKRAVHGMLPKNFLRDKRLTRLIIEQ
jgi:large subunit ribosomal protein L13